MCIAIITTEHPQYPFILLSNRDEYLHRPTATARWWDEPNSHVLGGYDLFRDVRGTWLGITRQGQIAVLTNFREEDEAFIEGARSRGEIVNSFLKVDPGALEATEEAAGRLLEQGIHGVGGFSLIFGSLKDVVKGEKKGLALISNRTPDVHGLIWIGRGAGETHALSNSHYGDMTWPKVFNAEIAVRKAVTENASNGESKEALFDRLFTIMSQDTLPKQADAEDWDIYTRQLRHSIFIPRIGKATYDGQWAGDTPIIKEHNHIDATTGLYGTQKQSIILVDRDGNVSFLERTLFDEIGKPIEKGQGDRLYEFKIQDW